MPNIISVAQNRTLKTANDKRAAITTALDNLIKYKEKNKESIVVDGRPHESSVEHSNHQALMVF